MGCGFLALLDQVMKSVASEVLGSNVAVEADGVEQVRLACAVGAGWLVKAEMGDNKTEQSRTEQRSTGQNGTDHSRLE